MAVLTKKQDISLDLNSFLPAQPNNQSSYLSTHKHISAASPSIENNMMNGFKTRKKLAQLAQENNPRKEMNGSANGHISPSESATTEPESTENIFLFYPNIIGPPACPPSTG